MQINAMSFHLKAVFILVLLDVIIFGHCIFTIVGFFIVLVPLIIALVINCVSNMMNKPITKKLKAKSYILLIYVVGCFLSISIFLVNQKISMYRAQTIIEACDNYKIEHGHYPSELSELMPKFLAVIPKAKLRLIGSIPFFYTANKTEEYTLLYTPYFGAHRIYGFKTKRWQTVI